MKQLIKKEFTFTAIPLTFIFIAFALMTFLPGYPILCGAFFVNLGLFFTFQTAREGNDILYTALLPVKKTAVVRARYILIVSVQMASFILMAIITLIRMVLLNNAAIYTTNAMMNANLFYLGCVCLIFAAFQLFFSNNFWKNAYNIGIPLLKFSIAAFLIIGIAETLHHLPGMAALNDATGMMALQVTVLIAGILIYLAATLYACKSSEAHFEKIDLHL